MKLNKKGLVTALVCSSARSVIQQGGGAVDSRLVYVREAASLLVGGWQNL